MQIFNQNSTFLTLIDVLALDSLNYTIGEVESQLNCKQVSIEIVVTDNENKTHAHYMLRFDLEIEPFSP